MMYFDRDKKIKASRKLFSDDRIFYDRKGRKVGYSRTSVRFLGPDRTYYYDEKGKKLGFSVDYIRSKEYYDMNYRKIGKSRYRDKHGYNEDLYDARGHQIGKKSTDWYWDEIYELK